jgi:hypothetical protein
VGKLQDIRFFKFINKDGLRLIAAIAIGSVSFNFPVWAHHDFPLHVLRLLPFFGCHEDI